MWYSIFLIASSTLVPKIFKLSIKNSFLINFSLFLSNLKYGFITLSHLYVYKVKELLNFLSYP
jgi:hypothetical protein